MSASTANLCCHKLQPDPSPPAAAVLPMGSTRMDTIHWCSSGTVKVPGTRRIASLAGWVSELKSLRRDGMRLSAGSIRCYVQHHPSSVWCIDQFSFFICVTWSRVHYWHSAAISHAVVFLCGISDAVLKQVDVGLSEAGMEEAHRLDAHCRFVVVFVLYRMMQQAPHSSAPQCIVPT